MASVISDNIDFFFEINIISYYNVDIDIYHRVIWLIKIHGKFIQKSYISGGNGI